MESLALGLRIFSVFSLILLLVGLYKPWIVLWWEDTQYRFKVIKVYGLASLLSWLASVLVNLFAA